MSSNLRFRIPLALALLVVAYFPLNAAAPDTNVWLNASGAGPRGVEDTLQQTLRRDYARAWQTMNTALENGDVRPLEQYFTGIAQTKLQALIKDENSTGVKVRYVDQGHQLQAVFYPRDGGAMLLHDTAQVQMEVTQNGKVIHSEPLAQKYVVLMTPAQDRWLVRVLQSVQNF
jgi:hypothetical protein